LRWTMQLTCPNCAQEIPAENINIQKMAAVCPACNTVFPFDMPDTKAKRRKVKQPRHLVLRDAETLSMTYRTNFRLDKDQAFVSNGTMSLVFTFITLLLANEFATGEVPVLLPLTFAVATLYTFYALALRIYNATHIEMDEDTIMVSRQPLPRILARTEEVDLSGVVAIKCEETPKSIKESYDTPRFNVYAEMADGRHKIIVTDVIEDYGFFIAQRLEERLDTDDDVDVSRLEDREPNTTNEQYVNGSAPKSQQHR
jgi:hypothetical protein